MWHGELGSTLMPAKAIRPLALRRMMPRLVVAVVITAAVAAMAPSAWATFPRLNGQLACQSSGSAEPRIFAIQPLAGFLDDEIS